jgi:hypothetical protein
MHKCGQTFSSMECGDPEVSDPEVSSDGSITCDVRIVRVCSDCSSEVKEANFSLEGTVEIPAEHAEHSLSAEASNSEMTERIVNKDRHGKVIKNYRYMKSMYGIEVDVTVRCDDCDVVIGSAHLQDEIQASRMEELE